MNLKIYKTFYNRMFSVFILFLLLFPTIEFASSCKGPIELYGVDRAERVKLVMKHNSVFQLLGKDVPKVRQAYLARDATCHRKVYALQKTEESGNSTIARFGMKGKKPMRSKNDELDFYFCTDPRSTLILHSVSIPEGENANTVYYVIPLLAFVLIMSAICSGLNLAIMSFSINDLKLIRESDTDKKKKKQAEDILRLRRNSNHVLCTIVMGNCLCNTSITILIMYIGNIYNFGASGYVEFSSSALLVIFTEILPSLICTKNALTIASKMQYFVVFAMILTFPISFPLSLVLDVFLGKESEDESKPLEIDTSQLEGLKEEELTDANEFNEMMNVVQKTLELRQKRAEDVMTAIDRVGMISEDQPVTHSFLSTIYEKGHSWLPVFQQEDHNKICGVLNVKDLMLLLDDEGRGTDTDLTAGTMLSVLEKRRKHCFVLNSLPVQQFMSELQQGCNMAIVVKYLEHLKDDEWDKNYQVIGIITLEDYIEEIVGEIFDEKDKGDTF